MQQLPLRLQQAPLLLRAEEAEEARRAQAAQVVLSAAPRPRRAAAGDEHGAIPSDDRIEKDVARWVEALKTILAKKGADRPAAGSAPPAEGQRRRCRGVTDAMLRQCVNGWGGPRQKKTWKEMWMPKDVEEYLLRARTSAPVSAPVSEPVSAPASASASDLASEPAVEPAPPIAGEDGQGGDGVGGSRKRTDPPSSDESSSDESSSDDDSDDEPMEGFVRRDGKWVLDRSKEAMSALRERGAQAWDSLFG